MDNSQLIFDQIGPLTNNLEDTYVRGYGWNRQNDNTSSSRKVDSYTCFKTKEKERYGFVRLFRTRWFNKEIKKVYEQTLDKLNKKDMKLNISLFLI